MLEVHTFNGESVARSIITNTVTRLEKLTPEKKLVDRPELHMLMVTRVVHDTQCKIRTEPGLSS